MTLSHNTIRSPRSLWESLLANSVGYDLIAQVQPTLCPPIVHEQTSLRFTLLQLTGGIYTKFQNEWAGAASPGGRAAEEPDTSMLSISWSPKLFPFITYRCAFWLFHSILPFLGVLQDARKACGDSTLTQVSVTEWLMMRIWSLSVRGFIRKRKKKIYLLSCTT